MTPIRSTLNLERRALLLSGAFAAGALVVAFFEPRSAVACCRLAIFTCMAPAIGCTVFALIHRITGGQWTAGLDPFIRGGVSLLPWIWVTAAPVLLVAREHYTPGLSYDGIVMVAARAFLFGLVFFGLRWALSDTLGSEADPRNNSRPWAGPVGLIVLFFMLTFLSDDWLQSLEGDWHSTGFTVVWIAGQAMCGLSLCILGGLLVGTRPAFRGSAGRALGLDWGNLLLAAMMFWAYVSFAQFLIIWAGNKPDETSWYLRRDRGAWTYVMPAVAFIGFAAPFFMLLSRRLKQSANGLAAVAGLLLVAHFSYIAWLTVPVQDDSAAGGLMAFIVMAASAAFFSSRFMRAARLLGRTA